jgi:hypothetical protein
VSVSPARFPFIDATQAAELVGVPRSEVLDWIAQGRLASFGGKVQNPFVRRADLERLARDVGLTLHDEVPRGSRSKNPSRRVQLRITADARWSEVAPEDIEAWARELETVERIAARRVAETALARLQHVLDRLGEQGSS